MAEIDVISTSDSDELPKVKYRRMVNSVSDILDKDVVSCVTTHPKFMCIGSVRGIVYLLDHEGNVATISSETSTKEKYFHAHSVAVNHISVDLSGDHIATCSDDGKVNVHGLYSSENNLSLSLGRTIKTVALDPSFKSATGCRVVFGDNKLTLYEKTFFNRAKYTILCDCEGYVSAIAWQDRFIALSGDIGVRVYDIVARCSLGLIKWENSQPEPLNKYKCSIIWSSNERLMIGWVDFVRICNIRKREAHEMKIKGTPEYMVELIHNIQLTYFVCGVAPFNDQLIVLGATNILDPNNIYQKPSVKILDYKQGTLSELSSDTLLVKGFQGYLSNNYYLTGIFQENRFYVVAPKDIVIVSHFDTDDKVKWLLKGNQFEKAIHLLKEDGGKSNDYTVLSLGILHMDYLLEKKDFEKAASVLAEICDIDQSLWKKEIYKFANEKALRYLSPYVPTSPDFKLSSQIYERILCENLDDGKAILKLIQEWDPSLYKINNIINALMAHLLITDNDKSIYLEILGILYCHQGRYDKALSMYLKLQHKDVFTLIEKHNLYNFIYDKILHLMILDSDQAVVTILDKVPVTVIEQQLQSNDYYLYKYLDALYKKKKSGKFHGSLVKLYAIYSREKLLPFLRCSDNYPIQEALDVCKSKNFYPETVYLLGRIGSTKEALDIIICKLNDINQAILFCQEHDDEELWMDLINHSLDKPEFISLLLKRIGNYIDPRVLIQGIKPGCMIDDLKDSLGKMMHDFNLQLSVQQACKAITFRNYFDIHNKLIQKHNKGVCISDEYMCSACHGKILTKDFPHTGDMIIFNCLHAFHMVCWQGIGRKWKDICAVCNPVKTD